MSSNKRGRSMGNQADTGIMYAIAVLLLAIYAMPFVGGYLLITGKEGGSKFLGGFLVVVGIIIWCVMGLF